MCILQPRELPGLLALHSSRAEHLFAGFRNVRVSPLNGPLEFRLAQFFLERVVALPPLRKLVDWVDHPQRGRATIASSPPCREVI